MSEIRQTNFRIDQTAADAFRAFCEEQGLSQAQGFDHLMQVLELDRAKSEVPGRATEIADFEMHVKALLGAYVQSVALGENTEVRVREDYARRLESKDSTIADYQDKLEAAKADAAELAAVRLQLIDAQQAAAEDRSKLAVKDEEIDLLRKQMERQLDDKDDIIATLRRDLSVAEIKADAYDALAVERDGLVGRLQAAETAIKEQEREHEIAMERAARAAEKALDAAVAEEKAKGEAVASRLREEIQGARIKAAEDLRAADKAWAEEIRSLEKALAAAQKELEILHEQEYHD